MTKSENLLAIESLTIMLTEKIEDYHECIKKDDTLEVRKQLRIKIKEIQMQIAELRESVDDQLQWCKDQASRNPTLWSGSTAFTLGGQSLSVLRETYNYLK